jgi:hypothetical protein
MDYLEFCTCQKWVTLNNTYLKVAHGMLVNSHIHLMLLLPLVTFKTNAIAFFIINKTSFELHVSNQPYLYHFYVLEHVIDEKDKSLIPKHIIVFWLAMKNNMASRVIIYMITLHINFLWAHVILDEGALFPTKLVEIFKPSQTFQ